MPETSGTVEIDCECPKCGHKFTVASYVTLEFDMGDYAPDNDWRD